MYLSLLIKEFVSYNRFAVVIALIVSGAVISSGVIMCKYVKLKLWFAYKLIESDLLLTIFLSLLITVLTCSLMILFSLVLYPIFFEKFDSIYGLK